jgi:predicted nucleic acid-binding protein
MRYMLDTNVCIDYLKGNSINIRDRIISAPKDSLCISAITLSELMFGVENSSNREKNLAVLNFFLLKIDIVPYDDQAGYAYGEIRKQLKQEGYHWRNGYAHSRTCQVFRCGSHYSQYKRIRSSTGFTDRGLVLSPGATALVLT